MTSLEHRVGQPRFSDSRERAFVGLLVAAGHIRTRLNEVCVAFGITHDQYNVLRILRGVHPDGHPRFEIADRLIERSPDVTRLLDRLAKEGLTERSRSPEDRRLSIARITEAGLQLLRQMDNEIAGVQDEFLGGLSEDELRAVNEALSAIPV